MRAERLAEAMAVEAIASGGDFAVAAPMSFARGGWQDHRNGGEDWRWEAAIHGPAAMWRYLAGWLGREIYLDRGGLVQ